MAFTVVMFGSLALAVIGTVVAMFFTMAGLTVLTAKGYGVAGTRLGAAAAAALLPVTALVVVLFAIRDRPTYPQDVLPVVATFGCFLLTIPGAGLYWALARRAPRRARTRTGPRRRRLRYGRWAAVVGGATVPVAALGWWFGGWELALRIVTVGVPVAGLLSGYERRIQAQLPPDSPPGAEVVYLRGFTSDGATTLKASEAETGWASGSARGWVNLEQFLADEVGRRLGGMVALGSPRDLLPPGGGDRIYPEAAHWRDEVTARALAARAVLMQPEASAAMAFELSVARRPDVLPRFFVVTAPADRTGAAGRLWWDFYRWLCGWRDTSWPEFARLLREAGFRAVDEDPGPGAVLAFDPDGRRVDCATNCRSPRQFVDAIVGRLDG